MSQISFARWAVMDALTTAQSIAGRAADELAGTDEAALFASLRDATHNFRIDGAEMKAIARVTFKKPE